MLNVYYFHGRASTVESQNISKMNNLFVAIERNTTQYNIYIYLSPVCLSVCLSVVRYIAYHNMVIRICDMHLCVQHIRCWKRCSFGSKCNLSFADSKHKASYNGVCVCSHTRTDNWKEEPSRESERERWKKWECWKEKREIESEKTSGCLVAQAILSHTHCTLCAHRMCRIQLAKKENWPEVKVVVLVFGAILLYLHPRTFVHTFRQRMSPRKDTHVHQFRQRVFFFPSIHVQFR